MRTNELEKLIAKATPLPWHLSPNKRAVYAKDQVAYTGNENDSKLIVHACNSILPLSRRCDELSGLLMQCIPYLVESLQRSNESLKGADPQSQFYGEDIVTPPLMTKIKTLLSQIESEKL